MTSIDAQLGIGIHPLDNSVPLNGSYNNESPVAQPGILHHVKGSKSFDTKNSEAVPVFERSAKEWTAGLVSISAANFFSRVVGRQRGRKSVTIWVPSTLASGAVPLGVIIGPTEDSVQVGINSAVVLNVGDSITIHTEGSVYCAPIPGNVAGACQFVCEINPIDGVE